MSEGIMSTGTVLQDGNSDKITSFFQDVQYHSLMVNSASFNVRLMRDRKTRLPFLDSQTGIAQNPCKLYMNSCHRMPGILQGQLYAYPAQRWCRKKRSYVAFQFQTPNENDLQEHSIIPVENPALLTEDTIAALENKSSDIFFYDETNFLDEEDEEPDNDDDDTYGSKTTGKKRRKPPKPKVPGQKSTRGRKRRDPAIFKIVTDADDEHPGKPYECALCGARYKTRQGLSYHLSHTHRNDGTGKPTNNNSAGVSNNSDAGNEGTSGGVGGFCPINYSYGEQSTVSPSVLKSNNDNAMTGLTDFQDNYLGYISNPSQDSSSSGFNMMDIHNNDSQNSIKEETPDLVDIVPSKIQVQPEKLKIATPNSYCDFCLGNTNYNVKKGEAEEMVSCADCGRSGHLTCLQFTPNMVVSVRQYRWQCIECKCCTLCGTSENDDKLLFCDDCDRGYHLYCLEPSLCEPPEGEWSCHLCQQLFHK